jgi:hypothetical protein
MVYNMTKGQEGDDRCAPNPRIRGVWKVIDHDMHDILQKGLEALLWFRDLGYRV